jgi:SAM-dependent methyltransferase
MRLLGEDELERSAVVANCRMNRERGLLGSNGYGRELGFDPIAFLKDRLVSDRPAAWLDMCCGSGKALIEAATLVHAENMDVQIIGVDLVGMFCRQDPSLACLRLVEASLTTWRADRAFDLITCVHGLHYVGDKLGLIARTASWLADDGLFVANLDLANLRLADGRAAGRRVSSDLRRAGLKYDRRRRLVVCRGRKVVDLPYRYLGADDRVGPNYTGQPAVDSYFDPIVGETAPPR